MSHRHAVAAVLAFAGACALPGAARAQEQGPSPEEIKAKIIEVERLMKSAEEALARSTDTRSAAERTAEAARKMLEQKALAETGKSSDQLRKEAESGSKEAAETIERLTRAANEEAKKAAEKMGDILGGGASGESASRGIQEIIKKIKGDGQGASNGIKWLLEKVVTEGKGQSGGSGGSSGKDKPQPNAPDPKKPDKNPEKPQDTSKKPESKTEPPRTPEFEQWYVALPPQIRKAYDSQDWDSIPPKWREMLKEWTKKLAEDIEKERR